MRAKGTLFHGGKILKIYIYIHVEVVDEGPAQLRMIYRGEPRWNNATEFKDRAR